jgi:hypothetical protein
VAYFPEIEMMMVLLMMMMKKKNLFGNKAYAFSGRVHF